MLLLTMTMVLIIIAKLTLKNVNQESLMLTLVLRLGVKKSPQLSFLISKKILFSIGRCPFVTFPEYEVGTKRNNQVVNRCARSCLA